MFELILSVNNVLIQESYKRAFAEKLGFPFETVDLQFKKYVQWAGKIFIQQQQKQEKSDSKYQLDREKLFVSLFYNWFIDTQLKDESQFLSDLHNFVSQVARADSDWLLAHTLNNNCSDE